MNEEIKNLLLELDSPETWTIGDAKDFYNKALKVIWDRRECMDKNSDEFHTISLLFHLIHMRNYFAPKCKKFTENLGDKNEPGN